MILRWLSKFWPILIVVVLCGLVVWKNVVSGTYLTGWDNLHTEFDFKTNIIDRGINGVWQYYQGLGVPSGNAHVADLPRQFALWIASWVVPQNLIRYGYHLTAWLGGGIGLYFLTLKMLVGEIGYRKKQIVALVGSIFYLFNLGTLQNFYAPYESFSHFYLMLPWLIYVFLSYLQIGGRKKLLWLALINLLAVPMSYIPTIFIVYMLVVGIMGLNELMASRLKNWKRVFVSGVVILIINSFWLLPFTHFVMNNTKGVVDAKINRMFTQEAFLRNEEYGDLKHSLIMEGFWFDTTDMTLIEGEHDFMMRPWMDYMGKQEVKAMMWTLIVMVGIGYLYALISRKRFAGLFVGITLIGLLALVNTNWPSGELFKYLQNNLPLFGQVLRFPFTKFILLVVIGYSAGIALFIEMAMKYLRNFGYIIVLLTMGGILLTQKPVFEGYFFYDNLRLKIPDEYFELFKYFQNEDRFRGRIANLPQPTFWGWTTYGWGYRGSGFPWYGIPQPILDRNFDVWSPESEQYFSEISNTIYDNDNQEYFLSVLDKYGIDYVWIDGWVVNPQKPKMLDMSQVEKWLIDGGYEASFTKDKQRVYKRIVPIVQTGLKPSTFKPWDGYPVVTVTRENVGPNDFVRAGNNVYESSDLPKYATFKDNSENIYGYKLKDMKNINISNPEIGKVYDLKKEFPELQYDERTWWIREVYIAYQSAQGASLKICLMRKDNPDCYYVGTDANENGGYRWGKFVMKETTSPSEIKFVITGGIEMKEVRFGYFDFPSYEKPLSQFIDNSTVTMSVDLSKNPAIAKNCYQFGKGEFSREVIKEGGNDFVRYSAYDASSCESMHVTDSGLLSQGGEIMLRTRNISGRPIKFCLRHDLPGDCLVEEIVKGEKNMWLDNIYQIPPVTKQGELYLEIDDYAVGKEMRINDVGKIELRGVSAQTTFKQQESNPYVNNQAYRNGWVGLDMKNWKLLSHIKVDGWSNGWMVPAGEHRIVIFYWPQLLEYLGFGLLGVTIVVLRRQKR